MLLEEPSRLLARPGKHFRAARFHEKINPLFPQQFDCANLAHTTPSLTEAHLGEIQRTLASAASAVSMPHRCARTASLRTNMTLLGDPRPNRMNVRNALILHHGIDPGWAISASLSTAWGRYRPACPKKHACSRCGGVGLYATPANVDRQVR
jgi:hypothetical protein